MRKQGHIHSLTMSGRDGPVVVVIYDDDISYTYLAELPLPVTIGNEVKFDYALHGNHVLGEYVISNVTKA